MRSGFRDVVSLRRDRFLMADIPISMHVHAARCRAGSIQEGRRSRILNQALDNDALLSAIRNALQRSSLALAQNAEMQELRQRYASLTSRERQVMALVVFAI